MADRNVRPTVDADISRQDWSGRIQTYPSECPAKPDQRRSYEIAVAAGIDGEFPFLLRDARGGSFSDYRGRGVADEQSSFAGEEYSLSAEVSKRVGAGVDGE